MSSCTTRGVRVDVTTTYLAEQSTPSRHQYVFAYQVTITNEGDAPVQLLARHWVITDGTGEIEEVRGPGVVGEQPTIYPGESYSYTSGCPLTTPVGTMHGSYTMICNGEQFEARIAPFTLACPEALN